MNNDSTNANVGAGEVAPAPDVMEFTPGGVTELDVSAIGGYPVRKIQCTAGAGVLNIRTARSGSTNRAMNVVVGTEIAPVQITSIRGTSDGTGGGITIRVYK